MSGRIYISFTISAFSGALSVRRTARQPVHKCASIITKTNLYRVPGLDSALLYTYYRDPAFGIIFVQTFAVVLKY